MDTIAAISTAKGRGGIAVVRISGPGAFDIARALSGKDAEPGKIAFAKILGEGCVVLAFKGPASYTGEDVVEIQCHGGFAAPRRMLEACYNHGAREARRGEFTERAFINGKMGYEEAEATIDLIDAKTIRAANSAIDSLGGRHRNAVRRLYEISLDISSTIEHALDIDENELPSDFFESVASRLESLENDVRREARTLNEGKILRSGALVAIGGRPNAGKSSLLNALLGESRAIVSSTPGTTRDSIEEWLDIDGWPVRLADTAGLRQTNDEIEESGIARAKALLEKADVLIALDDSLPGTNVKETIFIHPKCDISRGEGLNVSSKTGEGIEELKKEISRRLGRLAAFASDEARHESDERLSLLSQAAEHLKCAKNLSDLVLAGNETRSASSLLASLCGANYSSDLLERLFSRFCVGK